MRGIKLAITIASNAPYGQRTRTETTPNINATTPKT
jgi:hypothetical protein